MRDSYAQKNKTDNRETVGKNIEVRTISIDTDNQGEPLPTCNNQNDQIIYEDTQVPLLTIPD